MIRSLFRVEKLPKTEPREKRPQYPAVEMSRLMDYPCGFLGVNGLCIAARETRPTDSTDQGESADGLPIQSPDMNHNCDRTDL